MKSNIFSSRALLIFLAGLVVLSSVWILFVCLENENPSIKVETPSMTMAIGPSKNLLISVSDGKRGLRKILIAIVKDGKESILIDKEYPSGGFISGGKVNQDNISLSVEPKKLEIADGKAVLRMTAWDYSWQRWWNGNITTVEKEVVIDTKRPDVSVLSGIQNLNQGGSGIVIYSLSEPCEHNGVYAGGNYFQGYNGFFNDKNIYISFFALEYNKGPGTEVFVEATDDAGNSIRRGFKVFIKAQIFKKDSINISDGFLNSKMPEFNVEASKDSITPLADKFLKVNRDLRAENYNKITEIVKNTEKTPLWEGVFVSFPNAKKMAGFADHRDYNYQGKHIDSQVHLGIDLASVANAPVPAANRGKVVFAGDLGIYGKTVFVDHGLGLFSAYSHLNSFDVKEGDIIEKGGVVGRSGSTGLAAGDHLHFSMLVNNIFVNPLEWWDATWITNNITGKIQAVKSGSN
ncbi:MAG: M23 family metallopeptidase [Proteobacteria bacterium]|nr:M23 family metallopeptidase [Pseudomonadota bacterium]